MVENKNQTKQQQNYHVPEFNIKDFRIHIKLMKRHCKPAKRGIFDQLWL